MRFCDDLNVLVRHFSVVQILQRERYLYKPVHDLEFVELAPLPRSLVHKGVLHVCAFHTHSESAPANTPHHADAHSQVARAAVLRYETKVLADRSGNGGVSALTHGPVGRGDQSVCFAKPDTTTSTH